MGEQSSSQENLDFNSAHFGEESISLNVLIDLNNHYSPKMMDLSDYRAFYLLATETGRLGLQINASFVKGEEISYTYIPNF